MPNATKKIILAGLAVVAALFVGEVVLRLIGYGRVTPELNFGVNTTMALEQGNFLPDTGLFWKIPSHPRDAQFNVLQPDVPLPPPGDRRRILVLGDSCSRLSQNLPPYSVLLGDTLGADYEVWNAAVPGYTVWQGRAWWRRQLHAGDFAVAIVYFGWNDHWRSTGTTDPDFAQRQARRAPRLLTLFDRLPATPPLRLSPGDYRQTLTSLVEEMQAAGVRVILVAAPTNLTREAKQRLLQTGYLIPGDDAVALHRQYLGVLVEVARATEAEILNAVGIFSAQADPTKLMLRDGIHLQDLGHRVMASVLAPVVTTVDGSVPDTTTLARRVQALLAALEEQP